MSSRPNLAAIDIDRHPVANENGVYLLSRGYACIFSTVNCGVSLLAVADFVGSVGNDVKALPEEATEEQKSESPRSEDLLGN